MAVESPGFEIISIPVSRFARASHITRQSGSGIPAASLLVRPDAFGLGEAMSISFRIVVGLTILLTLMSTLSLGQATPPSADTYVSRTATASSVVPSLVKLSGAVRDGQGKPLNGIVGITFALYKDQQGGAPLWQETQNVTLDASGRYTVQLGSTLPGGLPLDVFISGEARWLGVQAEGQVEQPHVLLLSVPYALKACLMRFDVRVFDEVNGISYSLKENAIISTEIKRTVHSSAVNLGQHFRQTVPVFPRFIDKKLACVGQAQNDETVIAVIYTAVLDEANMQPCWSFVGSNGHNDGDDACQSGCRNESEWGQSGERLLQW